MLIMLTGIINAEAYTATSYNTLFDGLSQRAVDLGAGLGAIDGIDFNPDHEGFSIGLGYSEVASYNFSGKAAAFGAQYATDKVAFNMKAAVNNSDEYVVTTGIVIGF